MSYERLEEHVQDSPEWHEARRSSLGASEVAAVLGLSRWESPYSVWQSKMGVRNEIPENLAYFGHALEEPITQWLKDKHPEVGKIWRGMSVRSVEHPWLSATPDRTVRVGTGGVVVPIELKTSSAYSKDLWSDGVPDYYKIQSIVQQGILGSELGWLAVLHGGNDPELYRIPFDPDVWGQIIRITGEWWEEYVVPKKAPPPISLDEASARWDGREVTEVSADAIEGGERLLELWEEHGRQQAIAVEQVDLLSNIKLELQKAMGEATDLTYQGRTLYHWRRNKPSIRFNEKKFKAAHPELWDEFAEEKQGARPFKRVPQKEITNGQ